MRGSIERRGESSWRIRMYLGRGADGKKKYLTRTVHGTRDDADQACARLLLEVGNGQHLGEDATVASLLAAWFEMATPHLSPSTVVDYRSGIKTHIVPAVGHIPLRKLRAADLDRLYGRMLADGYAPATIYRQHSTLRRALKQAVRWGWIQENPALHASPPPVRSKDIIPPEASHLRMLLELAERTDPDFACFLLLAADTGARRGELCALAWDAVDLDSGSLLIGRAIVDGGKGVGLVVKGTKTHQARRVALSAATVKTLRKHRARCAERALGIQAAFEPDAFVFSTQPDGSLPWRPDVVSHRFITLRTRANLPAIRLHDLRHFVATTLLAAGTDVRTVSGRLGHARASQTLDRYGHFVPANDRAAADHLGKLLGS